MPVASVTVQQMLQCIEPQLERFQDMVQRYVRTATPWDWESEVGWSPIQYDSQSEMAAGSAEPTTDAHNGESETVAWEVEVDSFLTSADETPETAQYVESIDFDRLEDRLLTLLRGKRDYRDTSFALVGA